MMKKVFAALIVVILSGCASSGRIGDLPTVIGGSASSQIVLIRVSSLVGAANSYYVALDGKDVFSIRSGQYTTFPIPTGEHFVAVKCFGGWSPTWKEDSKRFVAMKDQTNYFVISPNLSCAEVNSVAEEDGKKKMAESNFVSPETVSGK
jgi:hypothetical protein